MSLDGSDIGGVEDRFPSDTIRPGDEEVRMKSSRILYVIIVFLVVVSCSMARGDGNANTWKVTRNVVVGSSGFTNALTTT